MESSMFNATTIVTVQSGLSVRYTPSDHDSPVVCAGSLVLAVLLFSLVMGLDHRRYKRATRWSDGLQQRATLERIFQTHYWSQDYRTQNAAEDYRSSTLHSQPDSPR